MMSPSILAGSAFLTGIFFSKEDLRYVALSQTLKPVHSFLTIFLLMVFYVSTGAIWLYNTFLGGVWESWIQSIIYFECFWSFLLFYWYYYISAMSMINIVQQLLWSVINCISRCLYMVIESICTYKFPQFDITTRGCFDMWSVIYIHRTIVSIKFNFLLISIFNCWK